MTISERKMAQWWVEFNRWTWPTELGECPIENERDAARVGCRILAAILPRSLRLEEWRKREPLVVSDD